MAIRVHRHEVVVAFERPPCTVDEANADVVEVVQLESFLRCGLSARDAGERSTESLLLAEPAVASCKPGGERRNWDR